MLEELLPVIGDRSAATNSFFSLRRRHLVFEIKNKQISAEKPEH